MHEQGKQVSNGPVTVVDYGLGNLFSIDRALTYLGASADITSSPEAIRRAGRLVLPGVGAFGDGMRQLQERGLIEPILAFAGSGRPLLGICLGMQLLFDESEEFGLYSGLGLIEGRVIRLHDQDPTGRHVKVPHIGWNELHQPKHSEHWGSTPLDGLEEGDAVYFVHSFVPYPELDSVTIARMSYGGHWYCAAVQKENVLGVQFHPEKSGNVGLLVLRNFLANTV